jgi:hypothetical protein
MNAERDFSLFFSGRRAAASFSLSPVGAFSLVAMVSPLLVTAAGFSMKLSRYAIRAAVL